MHSLMDLPVHVSTVHVLSFLDVPDLLRLSATCRRWYATTTQDCVWGPLTESRWTHRANCVVGEMYARATMDDATVATLTAKELKHVCSVGYGISADVLGFVEKSEFRDAITSAQKRVVGVGGNKWPLLRGKWRASYVCKELDMRRQAATDAELCSLEWVLFFKEDPLSANYRVQFHRDGRITAAAAPFQELTWRRVFDGRISVHGRPPHTPTRLPDWSFMFQNEYAIYFQCWTGFDLSETCRVLASGEHSYYAYMN